MVLVRGRVQLNGRAIFTQIAEPFGAYSLPDG
jgi:hypothetical protein